MPVNPYDDRKVSLRRPHGNGDLDIVRASYTRRKANVTDALITTFNCDKELIIIWVHASFFCKILCTCRETEIAPKRAT